MRIAIVSLSLTTLALTSGLWAQTRDPAIQKMALEVSVGRMGNIVRTLAGFGTRDNYSDPNQKDRGIGAARLWIFDQFRSYSPRLQVSYDTTKKGATDISSIVAVLPGVSQPQKRIIVAGHYDSIARARDTRAPGADDDASGTAVVLELARVMSQRRFQKTIVFVAFAGEEIGLVGSNLYAVRAKASKEEIEAVLNNDIVGANVVGVIHNDVDGSDDMAPDGDDGDTGYRLRIYSPEPAQSPSRKLAHLIQETAALYVPRLHLDLMSTADRYGRSGDHVPFQQNGFAAVRFTSASEHSNTQHTSDDTPDGVSAAFNAEVAKLNGAAAAALAVPSK